MSDDYNLFARNSVAYLKKNLPVSTLIKKIVIKKKSRPIPNLTTSIWL